MIAPKSARNFIASRALFKSCWRLAGSSSSPFQEMVTTWRLRLETSRCICAAVNPYSSRRRGKPARRTPMKPVSCITSSMLVKGAGGKYLQSAEESAHLMFRFAGKLLSASARAAGSSAREAMKFRRLIIVILSGEFHFAFPGRNHYTSACKQHNYAGRYSDLVRASSRDLLAREGLKIPQEQKHAR